MHRDLKQAVEQQTTRVQNQKVELEKLKSIWIQFFDELPQQTQRLKILRNKKIRLEGEVKIILPISGVTEEDALKPHRERLLYFLRKNLQNTFLEISLKREQNHTQSAKPYTARDKFKHLGGSPVGGGPPGVRLCRARS